MKNQKPLTGSVVGVKKKRNEIWDRKTASKEET